MLTVLEAAKRVGRNPETVRRWIREGRLKAQKLGGQHFIEEADLSPGSGFAEGEGDVELMPIPDWLRNGATDEELKATLRAVRSARDSH